MISLDQIALWYLIIFGLYIGTNAIVIKGVINSKRIFTILAGFSSLIVLTYYMYNIYYTEGMRVSMPQKSKTLPSADLVNIYQGNVHVELPPDH